MNPVSDAEKAYIAGGTLVTAALGVLMFYFLFPNPTVNVVQLPVV